MSRSSPVSTLLGGLIVATLAVPAMVAATAQAATVLFVQPSATAELAQDMADLLAAQRPAIRPISPATLCDDEPGCLERRWLHVDLGALGLEELTSGEAWLSYDLDEALRKVTPRQLLRESEDSIVVRLLISEVGADRLLVNAHNLREAVAILYTVDNRRDPYWSNPEGIEDYIPYLGCEPGTTYATCANAREYLGLGTWRGLYPGLHRDRETLMRAADLAIVARYLQKTGLVRDFTEGSTAFVHRCGGTGYGKGTYHCDGSLDLGVPDIPGAHPNKGPAVFKALTTFDPRGFYNQRHTVWVDYALRAPDAPSPEAAISVWAPEPAAPRGATRIAPA